MNLGGLQASSPSPGWAVVQDRKAAEKTGGKGKEAAGEAKGDLKQAGEKVMDALKRTDLNAGRGESPRGMHAFACPGSLEGAVTGIHAPHGQEWLKNLRRRTSVHEKTLTGFSWLPQVCRSAWKVSKTTNRSCSFRDPGIGQAGQSMLMGSRPHRCRGCLTLLSQRGLGISSAGKVTLKTLEETKRGGVQRPEHRLSHWKSLRTHHAEPDASCLLPDQVAALLSCDPGVRSGAQDASRAMMAAAGRVRSELANHRRLLDGITVKSVLAELEWLSEALAPLCHFTPVGPHADGPWVSEAFARPDAGQGAAYAAAYTTALTALETDRYFRLVADLQLFCSVPPLRQARRARLRSSG